MGSIIFLSAAALSSAAFIIFPSLKDKINYFKYEWTLIENGEMKQGHNDAQRILSIQYGIETGMQHPLLGVGAGDIRDETDKAYHTNPEYASVVSKLPHNQFVFVFAATGIIGLLILIAGIVLPVTEKNRSRNPLLIAFLIILVLSFLSEHTLEIQIGTAFYLLFLLLLIHRTDHPDTEPTDHA